MNEARSAGSKAPRSTEAQDGSRSLQGDEGLVEAGRVRVKPERPSRGNGAFHPEGSHEGCETTKKQGCRERHPTSRDDTSEGHTLGVPVGWNKPASHCGRSPVVRLRKPVDGELAELEGCMSRRVMMALKGAKPKEAPLPKR